MRNRKFFNVIHLLIVLPFFWLSCDTSNSVDEPRYFVKYYGVSGNQEGVDIVIDSGNDVFYLFGNSTKLNGNKQLFLVKVDGNGMQMWDSPKYFGGKVYNNQARDIELSNDGTKLILAATSGSVEGDEDALLIITDLEGNKIDSVKHGYKSGANEDVVSVTQINDGYIITGSTTRLIVNPGLAGDQRDIFNFRLTTDLKDYNVVNNNIWTESFLAGTYDVGVKMIQINNNLFHFFGYSNQTLNKDLNRTDLDFVTYTVSGAGRPLSAPIYAGVSTSDERLTSVSLSPLQSGEGYFLTGLSTLTSGDKSLYITKLNKELNASNPDQNIVYQKSLMSLGTGSLDINSSSTPSIYSGFLILSNENTLGNQNFTLTKASNEGGQAWSPSDRFSFGGTGLDQIGAVKELADGKILMIGTFSIGDEGQKKMTLIKVNKDGKFAN